MMTDKTPSIPFKTYCEIKAKRILNFEFWPQWVVYPVVCLYILFLMIKYRSITLPIVANPMFKYGGIVGADKSDVLDRIYNSAPETALKKTEVDTSDKKALTTTIKKIGLPCAVKPVDGQRGDGVLIVKSEQDVQDLITRNLTGLYIIQSYVTGEEFGIGYSRYPGQESGEIFSLTHKQRPSIIGDGQSTIKELIINHPRLKLMSKFLFQRWRSILDQIPEEGYEVEVVPLGTHCKGAVFINCEQNITPQLTRTMDEITKNLEGFYIGRFDLKTPSFDDLKVGRNIKIIELNGLTSEPVHIYDPDYGYFRAMRDLCDYWRRVFEIAAVNRSKGETAPPIREIWRHIKVTQDKIAQAAKTV